MKPGPASEPQGFAIPLMFSKHRIVIQPQQ